jgi:hypothetical protein
MLRRPKHPKIKVAVPKEEEEEEFICIFCICVFCFFYCGYDASSMFCYSLVFCVDRFVKFVEGRLRGPVSGNISVFGWKD